jgi:hypothetical protein
MAVAVGNRRSSGPLRSKKRARMAFPGGIFAMGLHNYF